MSEISEFFKALDLAEILGQQSLNGKQLGSLINCHSLSEGFPDLENTDIAIIGVKESRFSVDNAGSEKGPDALRKEVYTLYQGSFEPRIADLGNIEAGHSVSDTYFALSTVLEYLIRRNIVPFVLGGSQDLSYAQFLGYKNLEQTINIVSVDHSFDLGSSEDEINNKNYLGKIILHQPNYLFNYSNIGYQTYLVDPSSLDMMTKLYFDVYRLGQIRSAIEESEPIIRQADMFSFDFSSIKHSDAPANPSASPNGFSAEEACQMMRYAGMSDKLSSIGLYELNPSLDFRSKTAQLGAQMLWCFLDGFYQRKQDFPNKSNPDYLHFHVVLQDEKYQINFYKSKKSDRWWMEIPYPPKKELRFERHTLIPCSFGDYEMATRNEIPDRWWQTYQKLY